MMRNLGPCPKCQEDELLLYRAGASIRLSCWECGWRTTLPYPPDGNIDDAIAAAVAKAKEPDPPHGFYAGTNPAYVPDADADDAA